ncbi:MAG: hypothetical protein KIS76_06135 [Pyrinomonadaceae bacterium]|nr:hypothetical protein [Pyrinomonadaceae bacterium]
MKKTIILAITLCIAAIGASAQTSEPVTVPAEVKPFIENGTKPIALESADLNGDALKDYVLVLERNALETDGDDYPTNQRPLLILVRGTDNKLREAKRNERMVMCSQCGGILGDPFAGVTVGKNTFTVNHYGGSAWRWSADYKFDYSRIDDTWQLVKIEKTSYHTLRPMEETLEETVLTPPKDYGKVDIADFDPEDYEEKPESTEETGPSFEKLDVKSFNDKIEKAYKANEDWVKMPTQVITNLVGEFSETKSRTIEIVAEIADITDELTVTVTDEGFADDSVRGEQYKFHLTLNDQGAWQVISAEKAQRCREGRGHQDYSPAPCL